VTLPGHDRNSDSDSAQPLPQARDSASIVAVIQPPEACTKDASRRAERSIEIAAWVVVIFACSQILMFPFGRDQGIFAVIADTILAGGMPYRDAWDVKPPLIFYLYALAQYLVGRRMVAIRIFEVIGLLSLYFPFRTIGRDFYHSREAGIFGWALAALAYAGADYWHTGQAESFGAMITIWALGVTVDRAPRLGRAVAWAAMGFLFGICFLLKPNLALSAVPCAAYAGWSEWRRTGAIWRAPVPALIAAASALAPIAGFAAWFWLRGAWDPMYETCLHHAAAYAGVSWKAAGETHSGLTSVVTGTLMFFLMRLPMIVVVGLAVAILIRRGASDEIAAASLLGAMIGLQLAGVAVQAKFFGYHYAVAVMLCAVVAGGGFAAIWERSREGGAWAKIRFAVIVLAVGIVFPAMLPESGSFHALPNFWRRSAIRTGWLLGVGPAHTRDELDQRLYQSYSTDPVAYRMTAAVIDRVAHPHDSVFIWGYEPVIYWLAERPHASRYVCDYPLRADWQQAQLRATLMRELEAAHPAVIVVEAGDFAPDIVGNNMDSMQSLKAFPQLNDYLSGYFTPIAQVARLTIRRRTTD